MDNSLSNNDLISTNNFFFNPNLLNNIGLNPIGANNLLSLRQFNNVVSIQYLINNSNIVNMNRVVCSTPLVPRKASEIFD
ncbi:hypothetical protein SAMN02745163_04568 [Clostridium cavendishii DSM 21758]|uniref:Uncharacterized protein n=1 Tax=Clostridium cavendishii DSM 21758 TaxID=1121302 RepID=A0A1M6VTX2_9CLOT|nr:hypothetical protein [Clostridium cavendishii]SHK84859.1 hypothetical protein SAMN02745163_04568 [Clostridium cavendishii DSM 21758]